MNLLSEYATLIEDAIAELPMPSGALKGLYEPIAYGLEAGGKRLRPVLALLAATAYGLKPQQAMPAALSVEMFHNFTLLHDDVMDNSPTRRGKPSVHAKWDVNTAILSGDTLYGMCYNQLLLLPDERLPKALRMFNDTAIGVFEGQQYDMDFEQREDVTLSEYLEMIRLKTSVLLGGAAALGAIAAGADDNEIGAWYTYGEALGIAFQIQDDWLDVYGDPKTFGKPIGGDILNAKKTFLTLTALDMPGADKLRAAFSLPPTQERIDTVRKIYDEMDIPQVCHAAIEDYTHKAIEALSTLKLPEEHRETLTNLALDLARRAK
ncbi:MAG: polyprenyl synthetase family protein [Muribaculaceae bacterium]|nr:polyprenyl synthetase family protein [Muribaculaceae bacterium]